MNQNMKFSEFTKNIFLPHSGNWYTVHQKNVNSYIILWFSDQKIKYVTKTKQIFLVVQLIDGPLKLVSIIKWRS